MTGSMRQIKWIHKSKLKGEGRETKYIKTRKKGTECSQKQVRQDRRGRAWKEQDKRPGMEPKCPVSTKCSVSSLGTNNCNTFQQSVCSFCFCYRSVQQTTTYYCCQSLGKLRQQRSACWIEQFQPHPQ